MKLAILLISLAGFLSTATAHNYDPALAPFATAHRAKLIKLADQRDAATRIARDAYFVALENAEVDATAKGDSKLAEAIAKETTAVKFDTFSSADGFPRKLVTARKALEKVIQQADSNADREAKKINASYLADLNRIPVGQGATQLLIKQIASEKKALTNGVIGPIVNPETDLPGTSWWVTEKPTEVWDFKYDGEVRLGGSRLSFPKPDEIVIEWGGNWFHATLAKNGRIFIENGRAKIVLSVEKKE